MPFSKLMTAFSATMLLNGCIIAGARYGSYDPAFAGNYESSYGYTTAFVPGNVYYAGGYYGGVYYRPGYYTTRAPFVTVYGQPNAYAQPVAQPVYGQPVQVQPVYGQPVQVQPVYGQPPSGQPVYGQPVYGRPVYGQPVYNPGVVYPQATVSGSVTIQSGGGQPVAVPVR